VVINKNLKIISVHDNTISDFADAILDYWGNRCYDLLHTHYWLSGLVGLELKKVLNVTWFHTFHTIERFKSINRDRARIEAEDEIMKKCDLVISSTWREKSLLKSVHPDLKVIAIPHGVDTSKFQPALNGHHSILYVGRIDPIKGLDLLIEAMQKIADVRIDIVGGQSKDHQYYESIRTAAARLNVRFAGPVHPDLLCDYYLNAGMVVVPSYYESFGLVGLEAMASARPVIGFKDTGLSETVGDDAGLLISRGIKSLRQAIQSLINNPDLRHKLGLKGRKKALSFSWDRIAERYLKIYAEVNKS
ncbi:MAG TPA: glycosyltransferase, partial [bacterium (Candidatus Stahlbacteria)]|nr:glycosyltransferase [Candidatus Stahlbacteria bacterium]